MSSLPCGSEILLGCCSGSSVRAAGTAHGARSQDCMSRPTPTSARAPHVSWANGGECVVRGAPPRAWVGRRVRSSSAEQLVTCARAAQPTIDMDVCSLLCWAGVVHTRQCEGCKRRPESYCGYVQASNFLQKHLHPPGLMIPACSHELALTTYHD